MLVYKASAHGKARPVLWWKRADAGVLSQALVAGEMWIPELRAPSFSYLRQGSGSAFSLFLRDTVHLLPERPGRPGSR